MNTAIRICVLMVGLFATFAAVAAPRPDGYPRPGFTSPDGYPRPGVTISHPDGYPRPGIANPDGYPRPGLR